ncbi:hypothetical protein THTE_4080 [Thermogutta terrifontis]|uniref:Uncharacterized protein n=1 Tax=Thermogutta terrifontis TaxID=1331910 RepID=A0A286RL61_9BACT|nr:hypothetical protein THTE_4080 [Thermogutta terrifontis]
MSKLREFSKTNSCPYQKRETPELEGALVGSVSQSWIIHSLSPGTEVPR